MTTEAKKNNSAPTQSTPARRHRENQEEKERAKRNWEFERSTERSQEIKRAKIRAGVVAQEKKVQDKKPKGMKDVDTPDRFANRDRINKS